MEKKEVNNTTKDILEKNEALMNELYSLKNKPRGRIGYIFLLSGIILASFSIDFQNYILAFISLAFLFWGGLFMYIRPSNYVRQEVLTSNILETYEYYNRLLKDYKIESNPIFFSPKKLEGFKEVSMAFPITNSKEIDLNDLYSPKSNTKYIKIQAIGSRTSRLIEEEAKENFSTINLDRLLFLIEKVLIEDLELIKKFESRVEDDLIQIRFSDSIYNEVYDPSDFDNHVDYLSNVIACILAFSTHRPVIIDNLKRESNMTIIDFKLI